MVPISEILQNERFRGADPDLQEELLDTYEAAVKEDAFQPGKFDMRGYLQTKQEVDAAKKALSLTPDSRNFFQRLKDEFVGGMENAAMASTAVQAATGLLDPETAAARIAEDDKDNQARPISRSMLKFQRSGKQGWYGPILNVFTNPESAALVAAQGLGSSVPGLVVGGAGAVGTRLAGGGKEVALAATMLGVGASSAIVEGGSRFLDDLRQEAGGNLQDTEAVANILRNPEKVATLKDRAINRGATVGAFDAASVALPASTIFKAARGLKGLAMQGLGDAAIQGMLGAGGEIAGNMAIGEKTDPADAWAEFIGEMVPGMIEVGIGGARNMIPQTEQAVKEKVGTAQFFPSQTSAPTIKTERQAGQFYPAKISPAAVTREAAKVPDTTTTAEPTPELTAPAPQPVASKVEEPVKETATADELATDEESKPSGYVFLNNRFGPFSITAETLAEQSGIKRGGLKVATSQDEDENLSDLGFEVTDNQDQAMKNNIDQADFAIVIGNDKTYANDPGQATFRNYAYDKESKNPNFKVIDGRSEGNIIPALEAHLTANPNQKSFVLIGPQNTAVRTTGKKREALIKEATNISQMVFQYLNNRSVNPAENQEMVRQVRDYTGMNYAKAADPDQLVNNVIPALRYASRKDSSQELLSQFDNSVSPQATNRVLVFPTDKQASHAKDLGPTAQKLGAEKGKLGLMGQTYGLPIYDERVKSKKAIDRQGQASSLNISKAGLELGKFFDVAAQNPDKEFWLMLGAYRNNFTKSEERALFSASGKNIPDNVRLLSSTAANILEKSSRPYTYVTEVTTQGKKKKTTRVAEVGNLERKINPEQALNPVDSDNELSIADRIKNKGQATLSHIILSQRQARSLLGAARSLQFDRRRAVVGTPAFGTDYKPKVPARNTRVSGFPFRAFARAKNQTMLVRVNNILPIGQENGVDVQTAAQLARVNPQVVDANNALGPQYLVDLDFYSEVSENYKRIPDFFRRESKAVKEAKTTGKPVEELKASDILPQAEQKAIGAQPGYLDTRYQGQNLVTEAEKADLVAKANKEAARTGKPYVAIGKEKTVVPNEKLAQYIRETLFEDDPQRFTESKDYSSLYAKAKKPFRPLTVQEKQTLNDALLTINSYRLGAKLTSDQNNLLRRSLDIVKDYAEFQNIALDAIDNTIEENTWALNRNGNYVEMLGRLLAQNPSLGSLARLNLFVPSLGTVSIQPDTLPQFKNGEVVGEVTPLKAVFTPGDTANLTDESGESLNLRPNSLYLYDQNNRVLQILPFSARNRFIPNARGTNLVPFDQVQYPTVSVKAFDTRDAQARASAEQEAVNEDQMKLVLGWASASGLLPKNVYTDWRGKFGLDVLNNINENRPVIATDPDTVKFIKSYPGVFTGLVQNGNSLMVTEVTTNFGKHSAEAPIEGMPEEFSNLFYRLLVPFFSMQEDLFNREIELGTKEEKFFLQPVKTVQKPEDIVGGGVGLVGDTAPVMSASGNEVPSTYTQLAQGERNFEEGLADDTLASTQGQRSMGEMAREDLRQGQQDLQRSYSEPAEGSKQIRSLRQNMLISPAMAELIRRVDPKGRFVRMVVLPEAFYKATNTGNESKVAVPGSAIVTGITDPRTGENMGDKRPIPTRPEEQIAAEEASLSEARTAAAGQLDMGQFVYIPKGSSIQDLVITHQNILNILKTKPGLTLISDDTVEFNQILAALQNVVSYDLAEDGLYLTGVYDYENGQWIGQLPYGDRRYTPNEIAGMTRDEAIFLGQNINNWLIDRRKAGVDTLTLNNANLTDDEIKNRVLLLQLTAQSYLEGFGGLRNQYEEDIANAMMAKTRTKKDSTFLESIDSQFQQAVNEGDFSPDELPLIRRMIEDAVIVFNTGTVYKPDSNELTAGSTRAIISKDPKATKYSISESGRPREHFLSRAKQSGIPEQEANNLVDGLSFNYTGQIKNSEFMRRIFIEALIKSRRPKGERLRAAFNKIELEYGAMVEAFDENYLSQSRPTNTLYGLVLNLARGGYGNVQGLASRAREVFQEMKLNDRSFISFEAGAEIIEGQAAAESKVNLVFNVDNMVSDYDAQKGLVADEYEADISDYEVLPSKSGRRQTKYESFIRDMAKYRETLPFVDRAIHDIIMRQGFNFPAGYKPAYLGKSNAQLDILFPMVKEKEGSQIGDEGKGKGFLSGKLLSSIFRLLPGIPATAIEPAALRQIASQRYEAILREMERLGVKELADFEQIKDTLRQYEAEKQAELDKQSAVRKGLEKTGRPVDKKTNPEARLLNMVVSTKRMGPLPEVLRNILAASPTTTISETSQRLLERMRQLAKASGQEPAFTLQQTLLEELIDPVGTFDDTIEKDSLISPEDDRARLTKILFEAVLPQFEFRGEGMLESTLTAMRRINAPYKTEANKRRVRRREKDISDIRKLAVEQNFADAGVSFDDALFNLKDEREIKAMEYLRAAARRTGLKNIRFAANRREFYPVFTLPGTGNPEDVINSTIFINPELLANKLFSEDVNFTSPEARETFNKLTDELADQLIKHEVAHIAYFNQIRADYRNRYPNEEISFDTYYADRVRKVSNFIRDPNNGLMVKRPGRKAVPVFEALSEMYPEARTSDEVLSAEFFRVFLELDKSNGKLFTEGIELRRSTQVADRIASIMRGAERDNLIRQDAFARENRKNFLEWLGTVLNALFSVFKTLSNSSDPTARKIYEIYGKVSQIYDHYFSEFVSPPKPIMEEVATAQGLVSMGDALSRQTPIGAQATEAVSRRVNQALGVENEDQPYNERTRAEVIAKLQGTNAIETVDEYINQITPDQITAIVSDANIDPDKITPAELMGTPLRLNLTERVALASYAISRFVETGQIHKAQKVTEILSRAGRGMGQTISIGFKLLKDFLLRTPAGVVAEYASRLAEGKRELRTKVGPQLEKLSEEVKALQSEMVGTALGSREVQSLINQINTLYSQALGQANPNDLAKIIRQHYTEFSGEKLINVLSALLPKFENKALLFELADMVQSNMLTQLGKQLSLRGRTLRRNIVNRKGMSDPAARAERIAQILTEMHAVVKPPLPKSGNTIEDAIAGDARKILELARYGALSDDEVLATIDSLGKFPSFDTNTAEELRRMMEEASKIPAGFQRDRKFLEAMKVLNASTYVEGIPTASAYWYMSLLSGPATFWMNFFSTMFKAAFDIATYSIAAANARSNPALALKYMGLGFKTFLASLNTIALAEAKGILLEGDLNPRTQGKYVDEDSINALESMDTGTLIKSILSKGKYVFRVMSASDALFGRSALEGFAAIQANIQAAENVENGLTNLSLEEEAARLLNQTDDFVTQATQTAISEGLAPGSADFIKRVYELRDRAIQNDPERAAILRRAEDLSLYATYNNKPYGLLGNIAEGIGKLSRQHPILVPLVVPFTKIVSNVTNESLNYVPVIGAYRMYKAFKEAGTRKTKGLATTAEELEKVKLIEAGNQYAVQAVLGTAAMIFAYVMSAMLKDKDDDGQDDGFVVTGTGPRDPASLRQAKEAGFTPYSFSFGGNQIKVSYLSTPLAMPLAILGAWTDQSKYRRGRRKDAWEKLTSAALTIGQVPFNQSFLQGLSGLFSMLDGSYEGQDRAALEKFVNSTLGSVVPNFARQVEQVFNPITPTQTSWWGKWIFNKVPIVREMTGKPTLNVLGEEVNAPMGIERYAFLQRFINTSEADPLFKLLAYKNAFIPDAKRGVTVAGNYQLNDGEFYRFRELRGKYLGRVLRSPNFMSMAKRMTQEQLDEYLSQLGSKASQAAKAQIVPELIRAGVKLY